MRDIAFMIVLSLAFAIVQGPSVHAQQASLNMIDPDAAPSAPSQGQSWLLANAVITSAALVGSATLGPDQDKPRHALAGYAVGNLSNGASQLLLPRHTEHRLLWSVLIGIGMSAVAGTVKELMDVGRGGKFDSADALGTLAGGTAGSLALNFDLSPILDSL
jgi:hypothetical protein